MIYPNPAQVISASYDRLGELANIYAKALKVGKENSASAQQAMRTAIAITDVLFILKNKIEYDSNGNVAALYRITTDQLDSLLGCLISLTDVTDINAYPLLTPGIEYRTVNVGARGPQGDPGSDGTNANITFTSSDGSVAIVESGDTTLKNVDLVADVYTAFTVSVSPTESLYEEGALIASLPIVLTINVGSKDITSVTVVGDTALNDALQAVLNLTDINSGANPNTTLTLTNVSADKTITFEVTDGDTTKQVQSIIDFVYPFLWGVSDSVLSGNPLYTNSTKIIKAQGDNNITFDGTDKYFYFGYIGTYPNVSKILDGNDDIVNADFNVSTISVTASSLNTNWTQNFTVYYSKYKVDISSQEYKFNF